MINLEFPEVQNIENEQSEASHKMILIVKRPSGINGEN